MTRKQALFMSYLATSPKMPISFDTKDLLFASPSDSLYQAQHFVLCTLSVIQSVTRTLHLQLFVSLVAPCLTL